MAAAAIVLLFLGVAAWFIKYDNGNDKPEVVTVTPKKTDTIQKTTAPSNGEYAEIKKNEVKEEKKAIKEVAPAVDPQKNFATTEKKEKNKKKASNIFDNKNVTQKSIEEGMAENNKTKKVEEKLDIVPKVTEGRKVVINTGIIKNSTAAINPADALANAQPTSLKQQEKEVVVYYEDLNTEESIKKSEASLTKKPVKALFRKVKGFFDNKDDNDEKKGISIAAFEFALK
jgi:hypothetical protein